jgi:hypothetical protein
VATQANRRRPAPFCTTLQERKGCGAGHQTKPRADRAARRFARLSRTAGCAWLAILLLVIASRLSAQNSPNPPSADPTPDWKPIEFLLGNWTAAGGGAQPGQGQGAFSFERQLNQHIIIRRNFAEYTSGPETGTRHDDLMIIYNETATEPFRAIYFDSEGHVIRYIVKAPAPNVAVFESDATESGPKYRLTYSLRGKELEGKFEVAAPGATYKTYLSWTSVKK